MDNILSFISDYWLLILIIFLALAVLSKFIKALKTIILLSIVAVLVLVFGYNYTPQQAIGKVFDAGKIIYDKGEEVFVDSVKPYLEKELEKADVSFNDDGTYVIQTTNFQIVGTKGEPVVTFVINEQETVVDLGLFGEQLQVQIEKLLEEK